MKKYNWYIIQDCLDNEKHIAQYYGREQGFECMVCEHGNNAYCFNIYYGEDQYQTWCYGKEHMPQIIKVIGASDKQIIDDEENINKYMKEVE